MYKQEQYQPNTPAVEAMLQEQRDLDRRGFDVWRSERRPRLEDPSDHGVDPVANHSQFARMVERTVEAIEARAGIRGRPPDYVLWSRKTGVPEAAYVTASTALASACEGARIPCTRVGAEIARRLLREGVRPIEQLTARGAAGGASVELDANILAHGLLRCVVAAFLVRQDSRTERKYLPGRVKLSPSGLPPSANAATLPRSFWHLGIVDLESRQRMPDLPPDDQLLASAIQYLVGGAEEDAASVLLACSLETEPWIDRMSPDATYHRMWVKLRGPRAAVEVLEHENHPQYKEIDRAFDAVLRPYGFFSNIVAGAEIIDIDPHWRSELLEIARGRAVNNQAAHGDRPAKMWQTLRFRSASEVRVAQALDRAGVLFLPNCRARLGFGRDRENREADFLICHKGLFGIVEVDGEPFHPPSRTVHDHERDRLFKAHGIRVIEHYDATRCYNDPDEVVQEFLRILENA